MYKNKLKKYFSFIMCIILCCTLFFGCNKKDESNVLNKNYNVPPEGSRVTVALGDSIAAGYGLSDQSGNYLSIFAANIGSSLQNYAVSGYDTSDILNQLNSADYKMKNSIKKANIIVLSIGGNNILHQKDLFISAIKSHFTSSGDFFTPEIEAVYSSFETDLSDIFNRLRSYNSDAIIIIQTLYNPVLKQGFRISVINAAKYVDKYIVRLNESIKNVADSREDIVVFDIADRLNGDTENFYKSTENFDIHPTLHGHASLASCFTDDFNKLISEKA